MTQANVYDALRFMLARDRDMASTENAIGFNKLDTVFAHSLGEQLERDGKLTAKQVTALRKILRKYHGQLGVEFDLDAKVETRLNKKERDKAEPVASRVYKVKNAKGKRAIAVTFQYDAGLVELARSVRGRWWNGSDKRNEYPFTAASLEAILWTFNGMGFEVEPSLLKHFEDELAERTEIAEAAVEVESEVNVPGLNGELYPFQAAGVNFLTATGGRAIIADEMGLGKTVQALAFCQLMRDTLDKVLVICPASLKFNWEAEALRWLDSDWSVKTIRNGKDALPSTGIAIINYDLLFKRRQELIAWDADLVILDECHFIKNRKSQRSKAVCGWKQQYTDEAGKKKWRTHKGVATQAKHVIPLSGTPFLNSPTEMFTSLMLVNPKEWGRSWFKLATQYTNCTHNGFGYDYSGVRNVQELRQRLQTSLIRREKSQVLPDLPAKTRSILPVEITNRALYDDAEADIINWLRKHEDEMAANRALRAKYIVKLSKLRRLMGEGKVKMALEFATNFLDSTGQKLVVFAHHKPVVNELAAGLTDYNPVKIVGDTSAKKRDEARQSFQEDPETRVIIISTAGGVGLTLHAASNLLMVEREWNPPTEWQIEDRIHRIGQDDKVNIWYLAGMDTADDYFAGLVKAKSDVFAAALNDPTLPVSEETVMDDMMDYFKQKGH